MSNEFGPQTYQIKKVLEKFKTLNQAQLNSLAASWDASRGSTRAASWGSTRAAGWDASRGSTRAASWGSSWAASRAGSWDAGWDASRDAGWGSSWAMRDAVGALHSRDLIGNKFTQAHYDYLVLPWKKVFGEFEEPPTVESLEKRVEVLEKYAKCTHVQDTSVAFAVPLYSHNFYESPVMSDLENRKVLARDKALAKLNAKNAESVKEYQAEKKRIEEMK